MRTQRTALWTVLMLGFAAAPHWAACGASDDSEVATCRDLPSPLLQASLAGGEVWVFNGIPKPMGWGEDLVYPAVDGLDDERQMCGLGGIPVVALWNRSGGVAFFNVSDVSEPFHVRVSAEGGSVEIEAWGASRIERYDFQGDFFVPLREYATRMATLGITTRSAPPWAFEPVWETYGFEEDFTADDILSLVPLLHELGIGVITLDSGWYGRGRGSDWDSQTGDFHVNPDVIGDDQALRSLISTLQQDGFRVRLWWVPGVAELGTELAEEHPEWLLDPVVSSTGDTQDIYLDPRLPAVRAWNQNLVERLLGYGADGFKQDDVYQILSDDPEAHRAYAALFQDILETAQALKPDFAINTCNCGLGQNVYHFPGENQLITSDPVGSRQFRIRAKVYRALNLGGAALLGDHVELTQGDVSPEDLRTPGFYDTVDFASVVPLGLVLQTKLHADPGAHYRTWFTLYRDRQFPFMEWVNIPYYGGMETYLMRDGSTLYYSFFSDRAENTVTLTHLTPGTLYSLRRLVTGQEIAQLNAASDTEELSVEFTGSFLLEAQPMP